MRYQSRYIHTVHEMRNLMERGHRMSIDDPYRHAQLNLDDHVDFAILCRTRGERTKEDGRRNAIVRRRIDVHATLRPVVAV